MTLLREAIGESLRRARIRQSRTLREVSGVARVSLGYLSEVERGRKEASSELLAAICQALQLSLPALLREAGTVLAMAEVAAAPTTQVAPRARVAVDTRIVIPAPKAEKLVLVQGK